MPSSNTSGSQTGDFRLLLYFLTTELLYLIRSNDLLRF